MFVDFNQYDFAETIYRHKKRPKVLAEGDSWFAIQIRRHLITQIDRMFDLSILNLANIGDEALSIMSGSQKQKIRDVLRNDDYDFDLIIFSGGGNDIVGEDLLPLLKTKPSHGTWEDCIHRERLSRRVQQIKSAYLDLIDMRDDHRPQCNIMTHGYDYPIPSNKGINLGLFASGPWMKPYMEEKGIRKQSDQNKLARFLMAQFGTIHKELEKKTKNYIYIETPGTLSRNDWGDEIHPTTNGFRKLARVFHPEVKKLFPNYVIKDS